jgi:hypothetical protein
LTHQWSFIRKDANLMLLKIVSISSWSWIDGYCFFEIWLIGLNDFDDVILVELNAAWLYLKEISIIFYLISDSVKKIIIHCILSNEIRNLHLVKGFLLLFFDFKQASEDLILIFIHFWCFSSKSFTFGIGVIFSMID